MLKTTLLQNKIAIVAGGGRGIGAGICNVLAESGAHVVVIDLDAAAADATVAEIARNGGKASAQVLNLSDNAAVERMVADVRKAHGGIDVLVNNAGGAFAYARFRRMAEWSEADFDMIMNRNLRYVFLTCRAVVKAMVEDKRKGSIVNLASISGTISAPMHSPYGAAKGGVVMLTKSIAAEYAQYGIRANAVSPGDIATPATSGIPAAGRGSDIPMRRPGEPRDIGKAVLFFASELSEFVTGQVLTVDGGSSVRFPLDRPGAPTNIA